MKYKMVVMDLDDTLLRDDLSISERTHDAIVSAQKLGVKIVLASGRPTCAVAPLAKELQLDKHDSYILSYNGALIVETKSNKEVYEKMLNGDSARRLYELSKKHDVFIHTYKNNAIITPKNNEYTQKESDITGLKVVEVENFDKKIGDKVVKVLMVDCPEKISQIENALRPHIGDKITMFTSKPYFLEFMENGVDKGFGVKILAEKLGISKDEIICIGDSFNDLGMIKYAGLGVAMRNAKEDIKSQANYIAPSNMEDGVAHVIEKFILSA